MVGGLTLDRQAMGELPTVDLCGMSLAAIDTTQLLDHIFEALSEQRGGWVVTANLDILRRYVHEPEAGRAYGMADVRVADGMPLVWASNLRGTPLPERVAGSSLIRPICERAQREGRSVYLLGGDPEASEAAATILRRDYPELNIAGQSSPWVALEPSEEEVEAMAAELTANPADIVLVAFGSPKQENVIAALRDRFQGSWWMGVGISLSFVAGHVHRAPPVIQKLGLEWVHRLAQEPRRLARRYLIEDLPFAVELFSRAAVDRVRRRT